jgi:hypothetical protein
MGTSMRAGRGSGGPAARRSRGRAAPAPRFDRREDAHGHARAVGDSRGQARGRGLVPGAQAQRPAHLAHERLGEARLDEREAGPALGGGLLAGAVVAQVVEVDAEHDRRRPRGPPAAPARPSARSCSGSSGRRRCCGSAASAISAVSTSPAQPPLGGQRRQSSSSTPASDGDTAVATAPIGNPRPMGHVRQERRVGTPAEGDHHLAARQLRLERRGRRARPPRQRCRSVRHACGRGPRRPCRPCPCRTGRTRRRACSRPVEAHGVHDLLEVVGLLGEQGHAPLEVVEAGGPGDHLQHSAANLRPDAPCSYMSSLRSS